MTPVMGLSTLSPSTRVAWPNWIGLRNWSASMRWMRTVKVSAGVGAMLTATCQAFTLELMKTIDDLVPVDQAEGLPS
ncbi:hypothetical protein D3C85_1278810 [compost metagenome]